MALIVGFATQKGGPGKSTDARGTGIGFAQNDWSVKIADFDLNQSTSTIWQQRRLQRGHQPQIDVEQFGSVAHALAQADNYDVMIFDGAPRASKDTAEMAEACDLLVIPTGLSLDDLDPAVKLADALHHKHGIPVERIAFALNHVGDSLAELEEAQEYLSQKPYHVLDGHLPQKVSYSRAMDIGLSVIEVSHKGLRAQAERLISAIIQRATALQSN
ncbi:ParA family protein [Pseudomonas fluorescens]|uniref:ParA family protein n=1 Tax=Pseudomonas fluorescens TaxID=294 RepID=UPI0011326E6D|nr:ParA family protein [Pseudomonas fluorescens]TMU77492.1 ParA family protein [Pseudomonas fluorescens]